MGASASATGKGELSSPHCPGPAPSRHAVGCSSQTLSASATSDHLCAVTPSSSAASGRPANRKRGRVSGFATLRKRLLIRSRRRTSKSFDHARVIRDFVSGWGAWELNALAEEYEAAAALKDLVVQANLARPPAATYKQDLANLHAYRYGADVDLLFRGACFPAHRALLASRCPFFRDLLAKVPPGGGLQAQVGVEVRTARFPYGMDVATFSALLSYLYTGEFHLSPSVVGLSPGARSSDHLDVLFQLGEEFGTPNRLEHDLRYLLDTGEYADCVLVFSASPSQQEFVPAPAPAPSGAPPTPGEHNPAVAAAVTSPDGVPALPTASTSGLTQDLSSHGVVSEYGFTSHKLELRCHKCILSARSPFFRNLLQRRAKAGGAEEGLSERALRTPTQIVLDDSVIPWQYARVLLHAIYLDTVDLSCILRSSGSVNSLCEVQAMVAGRGRPSMEEEAMEIYQIGRFLELDILIQGCEDIIAESLTLENLVSILRWSEQPHGSAWVHRQALHFLREEFQSIANSHVLYELDKMHMIDVLQSDFVQASELDLLQAVLKWGEHQLMRRMEEREPNLLSHTAHSVTKKGVKKRDLSDVELRDILSELLPLVRVDHVLPPNNEILCNAIKRGLVSTPPSHMIGDDSHNAIGYRISAWVRGKNNGLFVKPRLFTPYAEEVKVLLDDQAVEEMELVRLRMVRMSNIPDTLYMVDDKPSSRPTHIYTTSPYSSGLDIVAGAVPIPDVDTMQAMLKREQELRQSPTAQRAYTLSLSSRWDISRHIQLRVVREFNLPDPVADVLQSASQYCAYGDGDPRQPPERDLLPPMDRGAPPPPDHIQHHHHQHHLLHHHHHRHPGGVVTGRKPVCYLRQRLGVPYCREPLPYVPDLDPYHMLEIESGSCGEGHLSDIMPDIAMATASFGQIHLHEGGGEMELDLGDGTNHTANSGPMFL